MARSDLLAGRRPANWNPSPCLKVPPRFDVIKTSNIHFLLPAVFYMQLSLDAESSVSAAWLTDLLPVSSSTGVDGQTSVIDSKVGFFIQDKEIIFEQPCPILFYKNRGDFKKQKKPKKAI